MIWCLHGAVGMASDWDGFARAMRAAGHEVQSVDLWRFLECRGLSLEEAGQALAAEVLAVDPAPVLVGYSMGGRLALHALLASPELWRGAVIVSAHPGLGGERERILRMADDAQWAARALTGDWRAFLDQWDAQSVLGGAEGFDWEDRGRLEDRRAAVARSFMEWSLGKQADLRPELGRIPCPVLWLSGERDGRFTDLGAEGAAALARGRHRVLEGAGHRLPWEVSAAFEDETLRFLGTLGG